MKKRYFLPLLLVFALFLSSIALAAEVDPRVEAMVTEIGHADVLILFDTEIAEEIDVLKQDIVPGTAARVQRKILREQKKAIREQRREVLDGLALGGDVEEEIDLVLQEKYRYVNGLRGTITAAGLAKLRDHPLVSSIFLNDVVEISLNVGVPYSKGAFAGNISINNTVVNGSGIGICVVDTGVDINHTALGSSVVDEYCYCDGCCPGGVDESSSAADDHGHGTAVIGTIVSHDPTYAGMAPGASIMAVKTFNSSGSASTNDIVSGINKCLEKADTYNIKVFSFSFGGGGFSSACDSETIASTSNNLANLGYFVAAATGNDASSTLIGTPACGSNVTAVGAISDGTGQVASFSNSNSLLDLLAPGDDICTAKADVVGGGSCHTGIGGDPFYNNDGTSFSTPLVAGAGALLIHYKQLESATTLTPANITSYLSTYGIDVNDTRNGIIRPRIDVRSTLEGIDAGAPNLSFVDPTPADNATASAVNVTINVTVTDFVNNITNCSLDYNGTNMSMTKFGTGSNVSCALEVEINGTITYLVSAYDANGNVGATAQWTVHSALPVASNVNITPATAYRSTNLTCNYTYTDPNSDAENGTILYWYNDTVLQSDLTNSSIVNTTLLAVGESWHCGVVPSDGTYFGAQVNASAVVIANYAPVVSVENSTVNETEIVLLVVNVTDGDGDTVTLGINDSRFTQNGTNFTLITNLSSSASFTVRINATDGYTVVNTTVAIAIDDAVDTDGDGNPNFNDTDDDNDAINDTADRILGGLGTLDSDLDNANITINGSDNLSVNYSSSFAVVIKNGSDIVFNFTHDFNASVLDLYTLNISTRNTSNGEMTIRNLNISTTKTVYIDDFNSSATGVCVFDSSSASVSGMSAYCNATDEYFVPCDSSVAGNYSCTDTGTRLRIDGLRHSAIMEKCMDVDGDGYGNGCSLGADCADNDANRNPGETDIAGNGVDEDCDGSDATASSSSAAGGGGGGGLGPNKDTDDDDEDTDVGEEITEKEQVEEEEEKSAGGLQVKALEDDTHGLIVGDEPQSSSLGKVTGASVLDTLKGASKKVFMFVLILTIIGGLMFGTYVKTQLREEHTSVWEAPSESSVRSLIRGIKDLFRK